MAKRPETGLMRFGDDWTGIFIRGDDAFALRLMLEELLSELPKTKVLLKMQVEGFHTLMCRCFHPEAVSDPELQKLPAFEELKIKSV